MIALGRRSRDPVAGVGRQRTASFSAAVQEAAAARVVYMGAGDAADRPRHVHQLHARRLDARRNLADVVEQPVLLRASATYTTQLSAAAEHVVEALQVFATFYYCLLYTSDAADE